MALTDPLIQGGQYIPATSATPAQYGSTPFTTDSLSPTSTTLDPNVVQAAQPGQSATTTPFQIRPGFWASLIDTLQGGGISKSVAELNAAQNRQMMGGQQNFGDQWGVNPANPQAISQLSSLVMQNLVPKFGAQQAGYNAATAGSVNDYLKAIGGQPYQQALGANTARAGVNQGNMMSQQFLNALAQARGGADQQFGLGQSGASAQQAQNVAAVPQANLEATRAGQQNQYLSANPNYTPQQMQAQAALQVAQTDSLNRSKGFPGAPTEVFGPGNVYQGSTATPYPQTTINGVPMPVGKLAPNPVWVPSGSGQPTANYGSEDAFLRGNMDKGAGAGNTIQSPLSGQAPPQVDPRVLQIIQQALQQQRTVTPRK